MNALLDIRVLFLLDANVHSDAVTMSKLAWLPAWFWAGLWMLTSALMLALTLWLTRERDAPTAQAKGLPARRFTHPNKHV